MYRSLSVFLVAIAALVASAAPASAVAPPSLGAAADFAVLSAAPGGGGAVTCTNSFVVGDVGSSGAPASVVQTLCPVAGAIVAPVSTQVLTDFNDAYSEFDTDVACEYTNVPLAGATLAPGVYCYDSFVALTATTVTLDGPADGIWIFKVGTDSGYLEATNLSVVMTSGASACNSVYWWVDDYATLTTSNFQGTILAGAAITVTGGTFDGRALATAAVTLTDGSAVGCGASTAKPPKQHCNQGVGNGPEGCDPGKSNQGNPARSNDETGGTQGNPGRKGGNK